MVKLKLLITGILLVMASCGKDDEVQLSRTNYNGNELRIDGYYIGVNRFEDANEIYFFYRNGIVLYGTTYDETIPLEEIENNFLSDEFDRSIKETRLGWGVFNISSSNIEFEFWEDGSDRPLKTVVMSGDILNDTTFLVTSVFNNYDGGTTALNGTFRFKQFSPKPDSTNTFIK